MAEAKRDVLDILILAADLVLTGTNALAAITRAVKDGDTDPQRMLTLLNEATDDRKAAEQRLRDAITAAGGTPAPQPAPAPQPQPAPAPSVPGAATPAGQPPGPAPSGATGDRPPPIGGGDI
jgi:hypothetical protein